MNRDQRGQLAPLARSLCTIVKQSPGIHFRGLGRAANVSSAGQLRHHLDRLERRGEIIEVQDGRFKRFFMLADHDRRIRHGLARFARRVPHLIGQLLLDRTMNRTELRRTLGCADSTLGYHLSRMVEMGDVQRVPGRNCCNYSLVDPDFVRQLLAQPGPAPIIVRHDVASMQPGNGLAEPLIVGPPVAVGPHEPPQPPQPAVPFPAGMPEPHASTASSAAMG